MNNLAVSLRVVKKGKTLDMQKKYMQENVKVSSIEH